MSATTSIPKKRSSSRWSWIWFMYTGFLFITPFFEHTTLCWSVTLAAFVLFIAIYAAYISGVEHHTNLRFWMIGATFLLGMVVFPINEGASTFFIYTAALLPFNLASLRRILFLFFAEIFVVFIEGLFFTTRHGLLHVSWPNIFIALFLMGMVGGANIFFAQQKRADCQLRAVLEENLALAAVAERERIARDLHDVLGHTLSVIVLKAELANRL
ncbi:MAG: histidine kinase dimerization/phosphoacceptor domain-containing protein, partial [Acidobacteriaceae bacterium]